MIPTDEVYSILMNDEPLLALVNEKMIFSFFIPEDDKKVEKSPIVRLNEVGEVPSSFASNIPCSMTWAVQISAWSPETSILIAVQQRLDKVMLENGWIMARNYPIGQDPDMTEFMMLARVYQTTKIITID